MKIEIQKYTRHFPASGACPAGNWSNGTVVVTIGPIMPEAEFDELVAAIGRTVAAHTKTRLTA